MVTTTISVVAIRIYAEPYLKDLCCTSHRSARRGIRGSSISTIDDSVRKCRSHSSYDRIVQGCRGLEGRVSLLLAGEEPLLVALTRFSRFFTCCIMILIPTCRGFECGSPTLLNQDVWQLGRTDFPWVCFSQIFYISRGCGDVPYVNGTITLLCGFQPFPSTSQRVEH